MTQRVEPTGLWSSMVRWALLGLVLRLTVVGQTVVLVSDLSLTQTRSGPVSDFSTASV